MALGEEHDSTSVRSSAVVGKIPVGHPYAVSNQLAAQVRETGPEKQD